MTQRRRVTLERILDARHHRPLSVVRLPTACLAVAVVMLHGCGLPEPVVTEDELPGLIEDYLASPRGQDFLATQVEQVVDERFVDEPLVIDVPRDFSDPGSAVRSLDGVRIAASAIVTIQVAAGTYAMGTALDVHHPDGGNIHVLGAGSREVVLSFPEGESGLVIQDGMRLGKLSGITLRGPNVGNGYGVLVRANAWAGLSPDVVVEQFATGVVAIDGGNLFASELVARSNTERGGVVQFARAWFDNGTFEENGSHGLEVVMASASVSGTTFSNNGGHGLAATTSAVDANGAHFTANARSGLWAGNGSFVSCGGCVVDGSMEDGVIAEIGSGVYLVGATVANGNGSGVVAQYGAMAYALLDGNPGTVSRDNLGRGFAAHESSTIFATGSTATNNDAGGYLATDRSYLDASNASVVLDMSGTCRYEAVNWSQMYAAGSPAESPSCTAGPHTNCDTPDHLSCVDGL